MRRRPTLGQVTHILMIITLCFALWKLFALNTNRPFTYKRGDHIASNIWKAIPSAQRTVIIVDRAGCAYCRASMPFYARLSRAADDAGLAVVSVTSDDVAEHKLYLDANHVHVNQVIRLKDTPLKVSGTPTLIVADDHWTVLGAWVGEISPDDEDKVLHLVRSGSL